MECINSADSLEVKVHFDLMLKWPLRTLSKYMNTICHYNVLRFIVDPYNHEQPLSDWMYNLTITITYNPQEHMMTSPIQHMATWAALDSAVSASCQKLLLLRGREVETSKADAAQWDGIMWAELIHKPSKMYTYSVSIGSTCCQDAKYSGQCWSAGVE